MSPGERQAWLAARAREEALRARMAYVATWAALHPGGKRAPDMALAAYAEVRDLAAQLTEAAVRQLILERRATWDDEASPAPAQGELS